MLHSNPVNELVNELKSNNPQLIPFISTSGSLAGLKILNAHKAHVCCCHLLAEDKSEYNIPYVNTYLSNQKVVIINFAFREQGLIIHKHNPRAIEGVKDLVKSNIRFINRQTGSGTRVLFDQLLEENNISIADINGYHNEVNTHLELGIKILTGEADAGMGIKTIAHRLSLGFIPVIKERFDLIIDKDSFFLNQVQMLIDLMKTDQFKRNIFNYGGYDGQNTGKIIYTT